MASKTERIFKFFFAEVRMTSEGSSLKVVAIIRAVSSGAAFGRSVLVTMGIISSPFFLANS